MKVVVVAGGDAGPRDAAELHDAEMLIAADGGAAWLDAVGRDPDVLVGDLDSADAELVRRLERRGTLIERHPPEKDETDAELALERAARAGPDRVVVLGALGGDRLDHELANLLLLADPRWGERMPDMRAVRGATSIRVLRGPATLAIGAPPGSIVSLLPIGGDAHGIRTAGLRYRLDGDSLAFGRSRGLSNVVEQASASVSMEDGVLLVIEIATEGDE